MSTIVSAEAKERIEGFIERAEKEGGKLLLDGRGVVVKGKENGFYLGPTIIDHVTTDMEVGKTENFGPIFSIIRAKTLDEAIDIANSSPYGNGGSVFTQSGRAAEIYAKKIQIGMVGVNVGVPVPREPFSFGGWKDSRFSVTDRPSSATSQLSARYGCGLKFSSKSSGLAFSWVPGTAVARPDCTVPLRCRGT